LSNLLGNICGLNHTRTHSAQAHKVTLISDVIEMTTKRKWNLYRTNQNQCTWEILMHGWS